MTRATAMAEHERWMRRCISLAEEARRRGDVPVGTVVVRAGQLVAEASEELPSQPDVTDHAEVLAVRRACLAVGSADLSGCARYTTAEPCWMCGFAIRAAHIGLVVFGTATPGIGAFSSRYPVLSDPAIADLPPPPTVIAGVLLDACRELRVGNTAR